MNQNKYKIMFILYSWFRPPGIRMKCFCSNRKQEEVPVLCSVIKRKSFYGSKQVALNENVVK